MKQFLSILVLALTAFAVPTFAADKPVVKIGVSLPLTGDNAHIGEAMRDAMTMAKDDLPADTKFEYQLVFEDDAWEPKKAASVANKLISVDKVDALVSIASATGGVISPIAEQNKVIHFGIASAQKVADGDYNFIHWTTPSEEVRVMISELQKRGIKSVAIFTANQQGFLAIHDDFIKQLNGTNINVLSDETVNPDEKDFRSAIAKAKAQNPDYYLLFSLSPGLEILTKQIREAGIQTPMSSIESFGVSTEPSLYEGQWYIDAADAKKGFSEKFEKRFSKSLQIGGPNSYDIVNIIEQSFETAAAPAGVKPKQENVIKAIHKIKMDGMMGEISVDDKGVVFSPAAVKIIKDGKPASATATSSAQDTPAVEAVEPSGAQ